MNNNITFVIFTGNEEKRIGYIIRNFIKYGEVLVFDDSSTDKTAEVVKAAGGQYIIRPKTSDDSFAESQERFDFVKKYVKTDWIYWGYADNMAPKSLLDKVVEVIKEGKFKYIRVPLFTYIYDAKNPSLKGYSPMIFRKDYVDFTDNIIHGMGKFLGKDHEILTLPSRKEYAICHFSLYDMNKFILSHLFYAKAEAQSKFNRGKKFSVFMMLGALIRYFVLFFKFSFKNGVKGLMVALMYSYFRLMVYVKLYELENDISLESIENDFVKSKENILKEIEQ
ncbi:MAG: hypothetical protein COU29_04110 [Candidatus Magasanikbacteria bacterium CG10_big_fil_rev_8_21_14_0_10_36_32]|uniref:Glycosyltransferase 2-like domain-containing protein n=1 Tax=Candidatus Magasanikbacteria bacterium CG10_big_fil_rev_8_21_14_0_10_36_32 TaxID=1974646 RepID=A0A2M6W5T7_9BACT|nr:MAG: hypothetical protein COU29_04110 [Candidatus Magasanikbacteria bacterium CG10_big_fil_rev_8_21_14_0_10_36_32]